MNTRTIKLPNALTIALGQYFLNRQLANPQTTCVTYHGDGTTSRQIREGRKWDKNADCDRLSNALPQGWHFSATAGTFWITSPRTKKHHYYTNENLWPLAEVRKNSHA
jgi:hypothetical protein